MLFGEENSLKSTYEIKLEIQHCEIVDKTETIKANKSHL